MKKSVSFAILTLLTLSSAFAERKVLTGQEAVQKLQEIKNLKRPSQARGHSNPGRGTIRSSVSPTAKKHLRSQTQSQRLSEREALRLAYATKLEKLYGPISYDKEGIRSAAFDKTNPASWLELMLLAEVHARLETQSRLKFQDNSKKSLVEILNLLTLLRIKLSSLLPQELKSLPVSVNKIDGQSFTLASVMDQIQNLPPPDRLTLQDQASPSKVQTLAQKKSIVTPSELIRH